jgi:hypothetical protein
MLQSEGSEATLGSGDSGTPVSGGLTRESTVATVLTQEASVATSVMAL